MSRETNQRKLEELCDFVIEVSKGNFTLQLNSNNSGELEPLVLLHNMMNEELNILFHHLHGGKSYPEVLLLTLIVNENLEIKFITPQTLKTLGLNDMPTEIQNLLSSKSLKKLIKFIKKVKKSTTEKNKLKLNFNNKDGLVLKTTSEISFLPTSLDGFSILINAYQVFHKNEKLEKYRNMVETGKHKYPTRNRSILLQENRELIEKLQKYLLKNLDRKFSGMKELASTFNASESKLKKGFKFYYGTSIYKFVQEKRFEKAHLLLTETEKPVSAVAQECGFVSAAHFSRSFKKKFGYRPSDVQRKPE